MRFTRRWRLGAALTAATAVTLSGLVAGAPAFAVTQGPWSDTSLPADERAQLLVDVLTLDEKAELLVQTGGNGLPEYGVPAIRGKDASNGLSNPGGSTALPVGLALASSWDTDLAVEYGGVSGREAREAGFNSSAAPTVDLARTPWGGRNWEGFGEDPLLTGVIGAAATNGIQAEDIPAEVKHYNVYNEESRRAHVDAVIDERTLQEIHTRPWETVVTEADAASVMCSFNKVNGEYACGSETLLTDILKEQLGFQGFVQTDFNAAHSIQDYNAGLDTSGEQLTYSRGALTQAVRDGVVSEDRVTDAARRVLWTMFEYGIIDNPPVDSFATPKPTPAEISDATLALGDEVAVKAGEEGTVLLKNDSALPLSADALDSIAVLGAGADEYIDGGGSASVTTPTGVTTILDGITARAGSGVTVQYAPGTDEVGLPDTLPGPAPIPSGVLSDVSATYRMGANNPAGPTLLARTEKQINLRTGLSIDTDNNTSQVPGVGFPTALMAITAEWTTTLTAPATGTYGLSLSNLGNAKLYLDDELVLESPGAEVQVSTVDVDLIEGEPVDVRVEYTTDAANQFDGSLNDQPGAMLRLGWTPPADVVSPAVSDAAALAAESDVAVVVVRDYTGEAGDRANLTLPQGQDALIRAVVAANPRTIVVLATSGAVTMPWLQDVPGLIQAWYGGQTQGESVAKVLFGDVNPSGKLPVTFPESDEQAVASGVSNPFDIVDVLNPVVEYSDGIHTGYRGYAQNALTPLFSFGHGLSYTSFDYSGLTLPKIAPTDAAGTAATATLKVANSGSVAGTEVVQLYVGNLPTTVDTADRALAGFARVQLAAGETKTVEVPIDARSLQYWDAEADTWVMPSGSVAVSVGSSSTDIRATGSLQVTSDTTAPTVSVTVEPKKANGKNGWYTKSVTVTPVAKDDVDAAPTVEASIDGAPFAALTSPIVLKKDGAHKVQVRATDAAGNVSKVANATVKIDATKPTAAAKKSGKSKVALSAKDATAGVSGIQYRWVLKVGGKSRTFSWRTYKSPITVGSGDLAKLASKVLTLEYRSIDKAGNISATGKYAR